MLDIALFFTVVASPLYEMFSNLSSSVEGCLSLKLYFSKYTWGKRKDYYYTTVHAIQKPEMPFKFILIALKALNIVHENNAILKCNLIWTFVSKCTFLPQIIQSFNFHMTSLKHVDITLTYRNAQYVEYKSFSRIERE